jgi:pimeloyl-ACP methyl ester carboxylesterase
VLRDQVIPLSFGGFKYECRIVEQPDPTLAPILLLGGAFQDRYSWQRHEARLCPLATVITVDLPGSGDADALPARYGPEFLAGAVHHLIVELGLPPLNVMGGSYGGVVGYLLAQRYPQDIRRLLLCGSAAGVPEPLRDRTRHTMDLLRAGRLEDFTDAFLELLLCQDTERMVRRREPVARLLRRQLRALTPDGAEKYLHNTERLLAGPIWLPGPPPPVPMLVVSGEHDTLTTPAMCRATAEACPSGAFVLVADADHMLPLERPAEFLDLLIRFYAGQPIADLPYLAT